MLTQPEIQSEVKIPIFNELPTKHPGIRVIAAASGIREGFSFARVCDVNFQKTHIYAHILSHR